MDTNSTGIADISEHLNELSHRMKELRITAHRIEQHLESMAGQVLDVYHHYVLANAGGCDGLDELSNEVDAALALVEGLK